MNKKQAKDLQPVAGEEISQSVTFVYFLLAVGFVAMMPGLGLMIWVRGFNDTIKVVGAILCVFGILCMAGLMRVLLVGHRLIIGKDRLQEVTGKTQVTAQVPYQNIDKIELVQKAHGVPFSVPFIGIDLLDPEDAATYLPAKYAKKHFGWHYVLDSNNMTLPFFGRVTVFLVNYVLDSNSMPLQQVYDHLMPHYREWKAGSKA